MRLPWGPCYLFSVSSNSKQEGCSGRGLSSRVAICNIPWWLSSKEATWNAGDESLVPQWEELLEEETATYFSILAWKIPWTEEPDRLKSKGLLQTVRQDWANKHDHTNTQNTHFSTKNYKVCKKIKYGPYIRKIEINRNCSWGSLDIGFIIQWL